jgi:hypothetical protein
MRKLVFLSVWLTLGAGVFALSATHNSLAMGVAVVLLGAGELGTLVTLSRPQPPEGSTPEDSSCLSQLEERLRVTEDELASAIRELTALREQKEFDRQLID